jgi:hypothetical protein
LTTEYESLGLASGPQAVDCPTIAREVQERTVNVQAVLTRQTSQARQMLRKLLDGKIAVEPITVNGRRGFRLSGRLSVGRLLRADVLRAVEAATRAEENNSLTVVAPTGSARKAVGLGIRFETLVTAARRPYVVQKSGGLQHAYIRRAA